MKTFFSGFNGSSLPPVRSSTVFRYDGYIDGNNNLIDSGPNLLHLTPSGTPPTIYSDLQGADGNRLPARSLNGTNQYYFRAYSAIMNVFSGDHTWTAIVSFSNSVGSTVFGFVTASGGVIFWDDLYYFNFYYYKAGFVNVNAYGYMPNDGFYHVLQVVRADNSVTGYIDGIATTTIDVTGYGLDPGGGFLTIGDQSPGIGLLWKGSVLYTALDNISLSAMELKADLCQIQGLLSSISRRS